MSFVTIAQIKPFIHSGIYKALNLAAVVTDGQGTGEITNFDLIESEAAKIIRDITGRDIPTDTGSAPDWITVPAAYIIAKLAENLLQDVSPDFQDRIDANYDRALQLLKEHPLMDADGVVELQERATSKIGVINNMIEL